MPATPGDRACAASSGPNFPLRRPANPGRDHRGPCRLLHAVATTWTLLFEGGAEVLDTRGNGFERPPLSVPPPLRGASAAFPPPFLRNRGDESEFLPTLDFDARTALDGYVQRPRGSFRSLASLARRTKERAERESDLRAFVGLNVRARRDLYERDPEPVQSMTTSPSVSPSFARHPLREGSLARDSLPVVWRCRLGRRGRTAGNPMFRTVDNDLSHEVDSSAHLASSKSAISRRCRASDLRMGRSSSASTRQSSVWPHRRR